MCVCVCVCLCEYVVYVCVACMALLTVKVLNARSEDAFVGVSAWIGLLSFSTYDSFSLRALSCRTAGSIAQTLVHQRRAVNTLLFECSFVKSCVKS